MKIIKLYILVLVTVLGIGTTQAQMSSSKFREVRNYLDSMFEGLNKDLIPTGFLLDYGIDLVDMSNHEGTTIADSTVVNIDIYREIFRTLSSSDVRSRDLYGYVKSKLDNFEIQSNNNNITLSAALYEYNIVKANAIEDHLIEYDAINNKVSDVYNNNVWINPYDTKYVFAFVANTQVSNNSIVNYTLPGNLTFTNTIYSNIMFDAGDGNGYRNCYHGITMSVSYDSDGIKPLKLKLINKQGDVLEALTYIYIKSQHHHTMNNKIYTTKDYIKTAFNETVKARIAYDQQNGPIVKPFIVVEGFDPWELNGYAESNTGSYPLSNIHSGFTSYNSYDTIFYDLHANYGYNVIYVDWENCEADIRANASILQDIITDINSMKLANGSNEKNIVLGLSMGGLISRYALRDMEINNLEHQTATYVSGDTPHLGVNIPIGYQVFINQLLGLILNQSEPVDISNAVLNTEELKQLEIIKKYLTSRSARQMMYCYVKCTDLETGDYYSWQNELYHMGFPKGDAEKGITLLAIANDGKTYEPNTLIDSNHLLSFEGSLKGKLFKKIITEGLNEYFKDNILANLIPTFLALLDGGKLHISAKVNPFQESYINKTISSLNVKYHKKILNSLDVDWDIYKSNVDLSSEHYYYEDFIGSEYLIKIINSESDATANSICNQMLDFMPQILYTDGKYQLTWNGDLSANLLLRDRVLFVPTASALCINKHFFDITINDYTRDYLQDPTCTDISTPFYSYMIDTTSSDHTNFSYDAYKWIVNQINMKIDGPSIIHDSAMYSVIGIDDNDATIEWSVSDDSIAKIYPNGKLEMLKTGIVTITAKSYNNGKLYIQTKNVAVGFPDFVITKKFIAGEGYKFSATLVDNSQFDFNDINGFSYEWSLMNSNGETIKQTTSVSSFNYLPETDEVVTVLLCIADNNDESKKSDFRSITFNINTPFAVNYKYIVVNQFGFVYFVKDSASDTPTFCVGVPQEDFTISFRNLILDQNDSLLSLMSKYIKGHMCYLHCYDLINNTEIYLSGTKKSLNLQWEYDLFDCAFIVNDIEQAINHEGMTREAIAEYNIIIENSAMEALQSIPFKIIYNPTFGLL